MNNRIIRFKNLQELRQIKPYGADISLNYDGPHFESVLPLLVQVLEDPLYPIIAFTLSEARCSISNATLLGKAVQCSSHLETLIIEDIRSRNEEDPQITAFITEEITSSRLLHIGFIRLVFCDRSISNIARIVQSHCLISLVFTSLYIPTCFNLHRVTESIANCKTLQDVTFNHVVLDDQDLGYLSVFLRNSKLTRLVLRNNKEPTSYGSCPFSKESLDAFFLSLLHSTLPELVISNSLKDKHVEELFRVLHLTKLEKLTLSWNKLSNQFITSSLIPCLRDNIVHVKSLDIAANRFKS